MGPVRGASWVWASNCAPAAKSCAGLVFTFEIQGAPVENRVMLLRTLGAFRSSTALFSSLRGQVVSRWSRTDGKDCRSDGELSPPLCLKIARG